MGMAINRVWYDKQNVKQEEVCFVDVDVFGKTAENCNNYLRKGSPVLVEGRLKFDQWPDKATGANRSKLTVVAERVQFLGQAGDDTGNRERATDGHADDRQTRQTGRRRVDDDGLKPGGGGDDALDDEGDPIPF
jgi:single-strand DNA-binding protein